MAEQSAILGSSSEADGDAESDAQPQEDLQADIKGGNQAFGQYLNLFKSSSFALLRAKFETNSPSTIAIDPAYIMGAKRVLDFMFNLWQKGRLCDVTITARGQKTLHAHKIAIGAYSKNLCESFNEQPLSSICRLQLLDFDSETIYAILRFFYTTELELNDHVVEPILGCSVEMGVDTIIILCKEYLLGYKEENCLLYSSIADTHGLDIAAGITEFICDNYGEICKTEGFLSHSLSHIRQLVNDDRLNVSELELFLSIVAWVDHDRAERLTYAPSLVACVRMQLISPELLVTQVETVTHIFSIEVCQRQLYNAIKYHALKLSGSALAETAFLVQTPRNTGEQTSTTSDVTHISKIDRSHQSTKNVYIKVEKAETSSQGASIGLPPNKNLVTANGYNMTTQLILVAVGGIDVQNKGSGTPGRSIYTMDPSAKQWSPLTTLGQDTHHHGVVAIGSTIYVMGGAVYDHTDPEFLGGATKATYAYNHRNGGWRRLAEMKQARAYLAVAAYNGCIFAVGGEDENRRKLDSVECYDVVADRWSLVARMPRGGKIGMSAATWRDVLYIVGGFCRDRTGSPVLDDVECLDLQSMKWLRRRPLNVTPRCHASLAVARGGLYLVGGRAKLEGPPPTLTSLNDINVYDERTDTWKCVAELAVSRHDAGCAVVGSKLFIVGGLRTPSPYCLSSVECYDVTTGRWEENVDLPYNTTGVACCAIAISGEALDSMGHEE